jgi:hypothetical protein
MEEIFFFQYHLHMYKDQCMSLSIHERRFMIDRFVKQKNTEKEEIDKERRKANRKR